MKFGGHETFFLRPNWLTKGLVLVEDHERRIAESAGAGSKGRAGKGVDGVVWNSDAASDAMGVGRNMSKSIGWWLGRLGLVERSVPGDPLRVSQLGRVFAKNDRYFSDSASWWLLHVVLAMSGREDVFSWFFSLFRETRFTKGNIDGKLLSWLEDNDQRAPAIMTLQRDVAVLLQTYARQIPSPACDPEDNLDCPFRRLGLLMNRVEAGRYERRTVVCKIPPVAIAMALCLSLQSEAENDDKSKGNLEGEIPLGATGALPRLARLFGFDIEGASAAIVDASSRLGSDFLRIRRLPQGSVAVVRRLSIPEWVERHFDGAMSITVGSKQEAIGDVRRTGRTRRKSGHPKHNVSSRADSGRKSRARAKKGETAR